MVLLPTQSAFVAEYYARIVSTQWLRGRPPPQIFRPSFKGIPWFQTPNTSKTHRLMGFTENGSDGGGNNLQNRLSNAFLRGELGHTENLNVGSNHTCNYIIHRSQHERSEGWKITGTNRSTPNSLRIHCQTSPKGDRMVRLENLHDTGYYPQKSHSCQR